MARYIFITGGVVSSLGKGLMAASLAALLQARGYKVRIRKFDPYLNVDPGTMSPYQHGEVYVTDDGAETDLDLGHYERFTGVSAHQGDNITSGRVYQDIIAKERRGDYLGATVQVVPHVTDAIKEFALADQGDHDFILCEIGGTVGDIESLPFMEAIRQLRNELEPMQTLSVHVTLVPYIAAAGELKTKPTQHSVRELASLGIKPDVLLCRAEHPIPDSERQKIANFCNVRPQAVIPALDAKSIYAVPLQYHEEGLDAEVLRGFGITDAPEPDLDPWREVTDRYFYPEGEVTIGVVGKYVGLKDAYKSLNEALVHGGMANKVRVKLKWIDAEVFERDPSDIAAQLEPLHGILVPGGFGERGSEGSELIALAFGFPGQSIDAVVLYTIYAKAVPHPRMLATVRTPPPPAILTALLPHKDGTPLPQITRVAPHALRLEWADRIDLVAFGPAQTAEAETSERGFVRTPNEKRVIRPK